MTIAAWRGEIATYRGYKLIIDSADILAIAPNGDVACFPSMTRVRLWVRQHRGDRTRNRGGRGVMVEATGSQTPGSHAERGAAGRTRTRLTKV